MDAETRRHAIAFHERSRAAACWYVYNTETGMLEPVEAEPRNVLAECSPVAYWPCHDGREL